jgi:multidrug efflux pump subunit AcrB
MKLLEFPIRRYQFTMVLFFCLVALGWFTFAQMPREEDPSFKISAFTIASIMPGGDPEDLEQLVVKPIEDRLAELDDVRRLESSIVDGLAFTVIEFEAFTDADKKYDEVTREINALRPSLPDELRDIIIRKFSPGLVNIVQYALVSEDSPYRELEDLARNLKDALKAVDGVLTSETWAYPRRELRVEVDLARVGELRLSPFQIVQAIQSENASIPAGTLDLGARSYSLKTSGSYKNLDQVRDTVVAAVDGRPVRVRDVAEVRWDAQQLTHIGRYSGKRAVFVTANMKQGYNILEVKQRIDAAVQSFAGTLPARVTLEEGFDQSLNVASRLDRLYIDFAIAIGLVILTLLPLGWRAAGIVMIAIPLSLAFGMIILYFLGFSLNQLSIAGFVVALGLLVDDSIVVVENIARHLRMGYSRVQAAIAGTKQIFVAVLGCTATLIFAFVPLLALPGTAGKFIRVLPTTVIATIIGSLLIALFIIPFLASRLLREEKDERGSPLLQRVMGVIHRYYRPALHYCLARPRATTFVAIGGSLLLSAAIVPVIGSSLFPKADTPQFVISVETPDGSSLDQTDRAVRHAEQRLAEMPEVQSWFANVGHGNPRIYYNIFMRNDATNYGELFVRLREFDTRRTPQRLDDLRRALDGYPNARFTVREFSNGPPVSAPIEVRIVGPDLVVIERIARDVERLLEGLPGTRDIENPLAVSRTNLRLAVDPQKVAVLGVPMVDFDRMARLAISGLEAGTFKDPSGEQYPITVRTPLNGRANLDALDNLRIPTVNGSTLPLTQLGKLEFERAPVQIARYDRERSATVTAQIKSGFNTAKVTAEAVRRLDALEWPRGYRYVLGGDAEAGAEAFGGIGTAILVAVFGIFAILVLEFGSFKSTLIVLTVVPLGVFGGLLMLLLTGNSISFTASIGFIALIGIEIKNSILLVDFTNQLREQGVEIDEAIERAGEVRFLPILLTSATAIGGLLPLAVQNIGLYSPMAWVIIGGLITSTLLARLVTPVVYKMLPPTVDTPRSRGRLAEDEACGALL